MKLSADTVLQRTLSMTLQFGTSAGLEALVGGRKIDLGVEALSVIEFFARPATLRDAVKLFETRVASAQQLMELTGLILKLHEFGILVREGKETSPLSGDKKDFDSAFLHIRMLDDKRRTRTLIDAVSEIVQPGDVVVEIGTGTGILSVAAAKAGARHVYAIASGAIALAARTLFRTNNVEDNVTLISGRSTGIDLPERADVLISEIIGNDPLGEQVLETFLDARKRFLKPGARIVPSTLRVWGQVVTLPRSRLELHQFTEPTLAKWNEWYGIDFGGLAQLPNPNCCFTTKPVNAREWRAICAPVLLARIDLTTFNETIMESRGVATARHAGKANAVIIFFDMDCSPLLNHSNGPDESDESCNWRLPVWILENPLELAEGESFTIEYNYRDGGNAPRVTATRG